MVHVTITNAGVDLSPTSEVILRHQSWTDDEEIPKCRQDNAAIKVRHDVRTQEIRLMAPRPKQGNYSDVLSDRVKALPRHSGRDWQSFDPITLTRFGEVGLEPDGCFDIQNPKAILGQHRIDLETDPPPGLALEIDGTSSSNPEDYEPLRVPELWDLPRGLASGLPDGTGPSLTGHLIREQYLCNTRRRRCLVEPRHPAE
jgi:Uma2 family endonuclease